MNMKIVKPKRRDTGDPTPKADSDKHKNQESSKGRPSVRNPGTVIEALEEEEQSPHPRGTKGTRNNTKESTKAIIKLKEQV